MASRASIDQVARGPQSLIRQFVDLDLIGATSGLVFVIVANGIFVREPGVWWVMAPLVWLIGALLWARAEARRPRPLVALALVGVGNAAVAVSVAALFPFLWPIMGLTAITPLLLAMPFLERRAMAIAMGLTFVLSAAVAVTGLLNDDGGVVDDLDDTAELFLVGGALAAHTIPIGLIAWRQNQLQRQALADAERLNANLRRSEGQLTASRRRLVDAADAERSRIERDLHDGAQQRLVAVGLRLQLLAEQVESPAREGLVGAADELTEAMGELRELAHGIYPPVLEANGLPDAVAAVARRSSMPVTVEAEGVGRFSRSVETALYFVVMEALANVAKHSPEAVARVEVEQGDAVVRVEVSDTGTGFDLAAAGASRGLLNMRDRVGAVGGTFEVRTAPGEGTRVEVEVPLGTDGVDGQ